MPPTTAQIGESSCAAVVETVLGTLKSILRNGRLKSRDLRRQLLGHMGKSLSVYSRLGQELSSNRF